MPGINPEVLLWARETAGLSREKAAKALSIGGSKIPGDEMLRLYEEGKKEISRPILVKMANVYRRPLLIFYLPSPPARAARGEDFRTLPEELRIESNGSLDALVRDIYVRQDLVKNVLQDVEEAFPREYVGSVQIDRTPQEVSERLGAIIGFDINEFRRFGKSEEAFSYLRRLVESVGAFVLLMGNLGSHHTDIPVEAFRGFALSDKIAPFIVINDLDAPSARSFTLLHEFAHILIGVTGLSGSRSEQKIERYCNDIASLMLLPAGDLSKQNWYAENLESLAQKISGFARGLNISNSLVAYRLYSTGIIQLDTWNELSTKFRELWIAQKAATKESRGSSSGPSYYVVRRHKLGGAIVGLVQRTMREGALTATKAGRVLGVKPANVYNLVGTL
ncbi:XRE family transcriptional regulator [Pseudomonas sp. CCI4.2]|uniref:ImmA/IrrE family metallo-endopeptidase n=1 Tax=Pseudomonas sp. CCI4.2 TaxID=3048620 RepID=UPI002AC936DF|nr:XRE family transcriptional regulator [Pseudomonas sp. CCI4.2]MEB0091789.1 XRE family transcriptional regulator [Pseudomonas sp. CCI4.2]WPX54859.1 XRE family transcriptional regulator [Pseudomonas sp. CCI4.2]